MLEARTNEEHKCPFCGNDRRLARGRTRAGIPPNRCSGCRRTYYVRTGLANAAGRDPPKALKPGRMRQLVRCMCIDCGVPIRGPIGALKIDASMCCYKSRRTDPTAVERRIKEICETRVRYGYRRIHVLLRREGWQMNVKNTLRIHDALG